MSVCNLVRISRHRGCLTNACSAYSTLQNLKQLPTNVIGATCVTRQPGTHSVASPSAHVVTQSSCRFKSLHVSDTKTSFSLGVAGTEVLPDFTQLDDDLLQQDVCQNINKTLKLGQAGRLYAVVYLRSQQHKVTPGDIIIVKLDFPPNVGDRIRLEKVLLVGGEDFSLIGQPLLSRDMVRVEATVVEKTLSQNRVWFVYRKRKHFKKFHIIREMYTMLVINSVQVAGVPTSEADHKTSQASSETDHCTSHTSLT